jgi:pimeloyl-ACP methyl ester carboxylesterase
MRALSTFLVVAALAIAAPAWAFDPPSTGVVVIHGKWGRPGDPNIAPLAAALQKAGFIVDQPEMPWSGARLYDRSFDQAMDEIDAAVARLRAAGAKKIVVAGHSLGGAAVLRYGALGRPADAFVASAPGPVAESQGYQRVVGDSVVKALEMVAAGHPADKAQFYDPNSGERFRILPFTAAIYLSYNGPRGPANMGTNAERLGPVPILRLAPRFDPLTQAVDRLVWPKVPTSTPATRVEVIADHLGAPAAGRDAIVDWLRKLN